MSARVSSPEPVSQARKREPKDLGLCADYRQWISFEGCCSPSTGVAVKSKLPAKPEAERERTRALAAHRKTLQAGDQSPLLPRRRGGISLVKADSALRSE